MAATHAFDANVPLVDRGDDRVLAAQAAVDSEAFAQLYRKYVADVYRSCLRRLGNRETAEDVTSQLFSHAGRGLPSLRDKPFRLWLLSVAHHAVIDACRQRGMSHFGRCSVFLSVRPTHSSLITLGATWTHS